MSLQFDIEALNQIPINEVIVALGGNYPKDKEPGTQQYNMHCCNKAMHKEGDKKPSMSIWKDKNICKCHVCDLKGNPITVAKKVHSDFKEACKWLHETFAVPYKNGPIIVKKTNNNIQSEKKHSKNNIEYFSFDNNREFKKIKLEDYMNKYQELSQKQKLKFIYSYIYRFSLNTEKKAFYDYYKKRGIDKHPHLSILGFLSVEDVKVLEGELKQLFPIDDLICFGVLNNKDHKYFPLSWRQLKNAIVIPSFDIYTDLIEGMMFRPIDETTNKWFKGKELKLSVPSIADPFPFGVTYDLVKSAKKIYITEGHIDALSLPLGSAYIAVPGVQSFKEYQMGILENKEIVIVFDKDIPGDMATWGYATINSGLLKEPLAIPTIFINEIESVKKISKYMGYEFSIDKTEGIVEKISKVNIKKISILNWDSSLGKDINDLLQNGKLKKVFK